MTEDRMFDGGSPDDAMLGDLFSAFDDVSVSDELIAAAIGRAEAADDGAGSAPAVTAAAGGKAPRSARWRAIRVAAVAACLVLALGGGAAYAVPTSYVTVSGGDEQVVLGVNRFGTVVSARAEGDGSEDVIAGLDLVFQPFEESMARVVGAFGERDGDEAIDVRVESGDEAQRERLEGQSAPYRREAAQGPGADGAGVPAGEAGDGWEGDWAPERADDARAPERADDGQGQGAGQGDDRGSGQGEPAAAGGYAPEGAGGGQQAGSDSGSSGEPGGSGTGGGQGARDGAGEGQGGGPGR